MSADVPEHDVAIEATELVVASVSLVAESEQRTSGASIEPLFVVCTSTVGNGKCQLNAPMRLKRIRSTRKPYSTIKTNRTV